MGGTLKHRRVVVMPGPQLPGQPVNQREFTVYLDGRELVATRASLNRGAAVEVLHGGTRRPVGAAADPEAFAALQRVFAERGMLW